MIATACSLSSDHDGPKDWPTEIRKLEDDERYDWEREGTEQGQLDEN